MTTTGVELEHIDLGAHMAMDNHQLPGREQTNQKIKHWTTDLEIFAKELGVVIDTKDPKRSKGLSPGEVVVRTEKYGKNDFTPPPKHPEWVKYLLHFTDPFMILLIVAGVLCFIAYSLDTTQALNLYSAILLEGVTFLSCTFAYIQEGHADSAMAAFKNMIPKYATVIRDGVQVSIPAADIVPGDIVYIKLGTQVPADARLLWIQDLKVEMSSMTGEPNAVSRKLVGDEDQEVHASNLVFSTAQVVEGEGIGLVYNIGDQTLIGNIAKLASDTKEVETPLQREVSIFVKKLSIVAFISAVVFFAIGFGRTSNFLNAFVNGFIVVSVACVPEGLPATIVSCLGIASRRMAAKDCYVKQLSSVETLGSINLICSDKTGTLTQNKMAVENFWFDGISHQNTQVIANYSPAYMRQQKTSPTFMFMETIMAVCNRSRYEDNAQLTEEQVMDLEMLSNLDASKTFSTMRAKLNVRLVDDSKRKIVASDASELAMFKFVASRQSIDLLNYNVHKGFEMPFNSKIKMSMVVASWLDHNSKEPRRMLLIKGAPERLIDRSTTYMVHGRAQPIDGEFHRLYQEAYEKFGGGGERVIGFACLELDPRAECHFTSDTVPSANYTFLGLVTLKDPPKDSVPPAVKLIKSAGVRIFMVTGDHYLTAQAIARQVGIISPDSISNLDYCKESNQTTMEAWKDSSLDQFYQAVVFTGSEIEHFTTEDWNRALSKKEVVFARTSPEQKLIIVSNAQRLGNVVGVTGDGVNDSPALKKADIGIAMGIAGSDVSRDAAHMILMKDDFAAIVDGIEEGRTIFDNLTKSIFYNLTHWLPEVIAVIMNLAFGFPLGCNSIMILCIDLGTELAPSIALAHEVAESDVMARLPRNSATDRLVTFNLVFNSIILSGGTITFFSLVAFFMSFYYRGIRPADLAFTDVNSFFTVGNTNIFTSMGKTFDGNSQLTILAEAQSAYWLLVTGGQFFHVFMCKTRGSSIFSHGWFKNDQLNQGVIIEAFIILFILLVPWTQPFFASSSSFDPYAWLILLPCWFALFSRSEFGKFAVRNYPESFIAQWLKW